VSVFAGFSSRFSASTNGYQWSQQLMRDAIMPDIPIHNETDYDLLPWMINRIRAEAIEYFGDSLHAIRIQLGIHRHAFNPKTHEVRYAFYPSDYGFYHLPKPSDEYSGQAADRWRIPDVGNARITSDVIDASAEVDTNFDVMDDADMLDHDDDVEVDVLDHDDNVEVEFAGLDPDFDALDTHDPDLFF
jgi:hypothetical protein